MRSPETPDAPRNRYRTPGFALAAILILALGIGISAVVLLRAGSVVLGRRPFLAPYELVRVTEPHAQGDWVGLAAPSIAGPTTPLRSEDGWMES